jgi:hypothetical protein
MTGKQEVTDFLRFAHDPGSSKDSMSGGFHAICGLSIIGVRVHPS